MNPRIREFAEQCHHRYSEYNINLEKFTELIVRECALMCLEDEDSQRILKHFGIEE